jgi:hypothetical protein
MMPNFFQPAQPVGQQFLDQYSSYGFDPALQQYLAQQAQMSTYGGGINYQYDPTTQMFTGGIRGSGPMQVSLADMMQRVSPAITPNAQINPTYTDPFRPISGVTQPAIVPNSPINPTYTDPMRPVSGVAQPAIVPNAPINPTYTDPFRPVSGGTPMASTSPFGAYGFPGMANAMQQFQQNAASPAFPQLQMMNPFAARPFFNRMGLTGTSQSPFQAPTGTLF